MLTRGNRALLFTVGATWGLGFAIFAMTALLAAKIAHHYDFSFRFLVTTAILPGFTIVLVSQPLGNYVDRATTDRPRVLRWLLAVSVLALVLSGAAFERWELLGVLAFTGAGVLATVPVQSSLLADTFPIRARPIVFALYVGIGAVGFAAGPLIVAATTALFDGDAEWRVAFFVAAATRGRCSRSRPGACATRPEGTPRSKRCSTTTARSATSTSRPCTRSHGSGRSRPCAS